MNRVIAVLAALLMIAAALPAASQESPVYPSKTRRTLHTDEQVTRARQNIATYPDARARADAVINAADAWRDRSDEWLAGLITPPEVPRAFNISFSGCPVHGREAFKYGNYSFTIDLDKPFKVKCPVGGEEYPSNDFAAYLASGMKDRTLLTGPYPDDGRGWRKPGEEKKYWFVAYYNHWAWMSHIIPMTLNLSRAYVLTGDQRYAHQAVILLDRIADVYPGMDHNKQSRYAEEFSPGYTGKIVNAIWETGVGGNLAEAYDNVFDAVDGATDAQRFLGKSGAQIRENIERNLIREIVEAAYGPRIQGNFGMHQETLLTAAIVAQQDLKPVTDYLLYNTGQNLLREGIAYALANFVSRDGIGVNETAPGYSMIWPSQLTQIAELMPLAGVNLFDERRMRQLYLGLPRVIARDDLAPAIGDSGGVTSGAVTIPAWMTRIAMQRYGADFFDAMPGVQPVSGHGFSSYDDLFREAATEAAIPSPSVVRPSDLLSAYGLALLRGQNPEHPADLSLFFGTSLGHGHADRLNFELFGLGRRLMPDLGYPQFAAEDPEPPGWSRNTVSHNTVLVDAKKQTTVDCGEVRSFVGSPTVQFADVDAPAAYRGAVQTYRRSMALIETTAGPYAIDIFRVVGGHQHDYILHGPEGSFEAQGIELSAPQTEGTLAGPSVPYANFYDDPERSAPGYSSGFYGYAGSGFSFLTNVQRGEVARSWSGTWTLPGNAGHLRITWLPQVEEKVFVCDGKPPFRPGNPETLKYILNRRGDIGAPETAEPLASAFVSILEPYAGKPLVTGVSNLKLNGGEPLAIAVRVETDAGDDCIASSPTGRPFEAEGGLQFAGDFGVISREEDRLNRAFVSGAGTMSIDGVSLSCGDGLRGRIEGVDYAARSITVKAERCGASLPALAGRVAVITRAARSTAWRIAEARADGANGTISVRLEDLDPQTALLVASESGPGWFKTPNQLYLAGLGFYEGMTAVDETGRRLGRVMSIEDGRVSLDDSQARLVDVDHNGRILVRIFDFGVGDMIEVKPSAHVAQTADGRYRIQATSGVELGLPGARGARAVWQPDGGASQTVPVRGTKDGLVITIEREVLGGGRGELRVVATGS